MEEIHALLCEWQVPEALPFLTARSIKDIRALKLLKAEHADLIFPVEEFGLRLKFFESLDSWKINTEAASSIKIVFQDIEPADKSVDSVETAVSTDAEDAIDSSNQEPQKKKRKVSYKQPLESVASKAVKDLDIHSVLEAEEKGKIILEFYADNNRLAKRHRDVVTQIVVAALRKISHGLKNPDFKVTAHKIKGCFPSEDVETYYIGPNSPGNDRDMSIGKIPYRYRNARSYEKSLECPEAGPSSSSAATTSSVQRDKNPYNVILKAEITPAIRQAITWLETDALTVNDWSLVKRNWDQSAALRLQNFWQDKSDTSIANYIKTFKILTLPSGYTLLELDFNKIHPDKEMHLLQQWESFVKKTVILAHSDVQDQVAKDCLALAKSTQHPGSQAVLCLAILPALCPPTKKLTVQTGNKKSTIKVSIANSRSALFLHVTEASKLTTALKERREMLYSANKEYQPFLVFVGPKISDIKQSYVDAAGILYRLTTPAKAIDVCFKSIVALHMSFPKECSRVWMLIQRLLYNISTEWDTDVPFGIISSFKALSD